MKIICSFAELQRSFSTTPSSPRPQYQTGLLNCQICTTPLDLQTGQDGFITGEPKAQIHHTHHDYLNSSLVILLLDFAIASMDVLEKNNIPTPLYHIDQNKKKCHHKILYRFSLNWKHHMCLFVNPFFSWSKS